MLWKQHYRQMNEDVFKLYWHEWGKKRVVIASSILCIFHVRIWTDCIICLLYCIFIFMNQELNLLLRGAQIIFMLILCVHREVPNEIFYIFDWVYTLFCEVIIVSVRTISCVVSQAERCRSFCRIVKSETSIFDRDVQQSFIWITLRAAKSGLTILEIFYLQKHSLENIWRRNVDQSGQTTILLQIFCELSLYSQVIFKSMRVADDSF